jgi:hypothetical protein
LRVYIISLFNGDERGGYPPLGIGEERGECPPLGPVQDFLVIITIFAYVVVI